MPKRLAFFAVSFLFLFTFSSPAHAIFDNDVDKAKDFIKAGMYPQAIEQLNKRINEKPTDAEAHYLLGTCYMNTGDYGAAEERFKSAVRLKADYGNQIGGEFKKAGSAALNRGQVQQAQGLFAKAVEYQPNLKKEVALECLAAGKTYLRRGQTDVADGLFAMAVGYQPDLKKEMAGELKNAGSIALDQGNINRADALYHRALTYQSDLKGTITTEIFNQGITLFDQSRFDDADSRFSLAMNFDPTLSQKICDLYYTLGKKAGDAQCVPFYLRAKKYCGTYNKEIGDRLLAISKTKTSEKEIQDWRTKAANFVEVPPDYVVYSSGQIKIFELKAGMYTDHFIRIEHGKRLQIQYKDGEYEVHTRSGKIYQRGKLPAYQQEDIRIYAVTDVVIRLIFGE